MLATKHTLIVGGGRSALGAALLLKTKGKSPIVSDVAERYPEVVARLKRENIPFLLVPQDEHLLNNVDRLIVSPGLSPQLPLLQAARERKIPIISEIDLSLEYFHGAIIGVTGTNGKSTTTMLLAHFLKNLGIKAEESGNIGIPPSLLIAENRAPDCLVCELSSYQLDFSKSIPNKASLFMSFSPDHMERHGNMLEYFKAKWKLMLATEPSGLIVMPEVVYQYSQEYRQPQPKAPIVRLFMQEDTVTKPASGLFCVLSATNRSFEYSKYPGEVFTVNQADLSVHNLSNVIASALVVEHLYSAPFPKIWESLNSFNWLPYRFQLIGQINHQDVWNDSKSTNVESTLVALKSLKSPAILLLGGQPKGESFRPILDMRDKIKNLVTFGVAGPTIAKDLAELSPMVFPNLQLALPAVYKLIESVPSPILFSPACASFDEFRNFEHRGDYFNQFFAAKLDKAHHSLDD